MEVSEEQEKFVENLLLESAFGCHKEGVPNACEQLGNLLSKVKKDYDASRAVHKQNCDERKFSRSCFAYAKLVEDPIYKAVDKDQALEYYGKACDTGNALGCQAAGIKFSDPRFPNRDYKRALEYFIKGCDTFDFKSCINASEFYRQGKVVPKDMPKALEYAERGCQCGSVPGCINASIMHKRGDGVPQSEELSQKFKELGVDRMKREFEKKRLIHDPDYKPA